MRISLLFQSWQSNGKILIGGELKMLANPDETAAVGGARSNRSLVFLDPDTGLAPGKPTLDHVLDTEVRDIWRAMPAGDVLVFYQHETNKAGKPWVQPKREQFEDALGLARGSAKVAWGPDVARDVAFFYCVRDNSAGVSGAA